VNLRRDVGAPGTRRRSSPPSSQQGTIRGVRRLLVLAVLLTGCWQTTSPSPSVHTQTPAASQAVAVASDRVSPACRTSVRFLAAFADRFGDQLIALRPVIVTLPFDSGAAWTQISGMASTFRDYEGLEDKAAGCPATTAMGRTVAALRGRAQGAIDRSAAASVNDDAVQRTAAADLYELVPDVLTLATSVRTAAVTLDLADQTAVATRTAAPLGSLAPLPTPRPQPTATPRPAPSPAGTPPAGGGSRDAIQSDYYAGYGAELSRHDVTSVTGSWTQPRGTCTGTQSTGFGAWVGIENEDNLEQIGTAVDCVHGQGPVYYVWYEMFPDPSIRIRMRGFPGDAFTASVTRRGRQWTLAIRNRMSGERFSIVKTRATSGFVALWIDEAPSTQVNELGLHVLPLTRFGSVSMTGCSAVIDGRRRLIGDAGWSHYRFDMVTTSGSPKAITSGLSGGGSAFRTTWRHS